MSIRLGRTRTKLHERVIARVVEEPGVGRKLLGVADDIADDVRSTTSGSRRLKQFGRKMVTDTTDTGARAGTTWGPAVPVEYGTFQTPPLRILTSAAERHGRTEAGR